MGGTDLKNSTILIAEDNLQNYEYLLRALRPTGAQILWAKDGKEALEMYQQHPEINLILMDGMMPVMSGYDAAREIRLLAPGVPIVILTAYVTAASISAAVTAGCNDYLAKPIGVEELLTVVNKWMVT